MKCRMVQLWMNWRLDDGRALPARIRRHLAGCPRCRAVYDQRAQMESLLRRPFDAAASAPSPWLEGRIMAAVHDTRSSTRGRAGSGAVWRWWLSGGIAAAVLVGVMIPRWAADPSPAPAGPGAPGWAEVTARLTDGPTGWLADTNLNDPLQRELDLVVGDVRRAWGSLRNDFVPSTLLAVRD